MYKIRFLFLNLQRMGKVITAFCWHQKFVPKGLYAPDPVLYTCKIIKNVYKIRFRRDHFETCNIWAKRKGLSVVIKSLSPKCCLLLPGAIYMWKNMKKRLYMSIKSDFKEIVLKRATNGQKWYGLSVDINLCHQGVVCPCPGAIYMYKSIKIYTRTRCQVSVYRTTGPLVYLLFCENIIFQWNVDATPLKPLKWNGY